MWKIKIENDFFHASADETNGNKMQLALKNDTHMDYFGKPATAQLFQSIVAIVAIHAKKMHEPAGKIITNANVGTVGNDPAVDIEIFQYTEVGVEEIEKEKTE